MATDLAPLAGKRVWIAGHRGLVGSALVRRLTREGCEILTVDRSAVDLRDQARVRTWVLDQRPEVIFLAAATVGGVLDNIERPADFLADNLLIAANVMQAALAAQTRKLVYVASTAIYPVASPQPIQESALLQGPLDATHEGYAIAKIAGVKLVQAMRRQHGADFITAVPSNMYGPNDNFDIRRAHVVPALLRRTHEAKLRGDKALTMWGRGSALREFLYADDCADALAFLAQTYSDEQIVNVGTGAPVSILELTKLVCETVGFDGAIEHDLDKPEGAPQRWSDISRLRELGWAPRHSLREGLAATYAWLEANAGALRSGA